MKFVKVLKAEEADPNYMPSKLYDVLQKQVWKAFKMQNPMLEELYKLSEMISDAKFKDYLPSNSEIENEVEIEIEKLESYLSKLEDKLSHIVLGNRGKSMDLQWKAGVPNEKVK